MTREEALKVLEKHKSCLYEDCDPDKDCEYCDYHITGEEFEEAHKIAVETMESFTKQCIDKIYSEWKTFLESVDLNTIDKHIKGGE